MKTARQKAMDLIELAMDDRGSEKERLNAAVAAVALIHKEDLLASPLDDLLGSENKTVKAASKVIDTLTNSEFVDAIKTIGGSVRGARGGSRRRRR